MKKEEKDSISSAISVKQLSKKYSKKSEYAVKNASFEIKQGEFHGFIGANGAGKTTLIKSIIGAYYKGNYTGEITLFGLDNESIEAKIKLGYIPEKADFPSGLKAITYLRYMAYLGGMSRKEAKVKATEVLSKIGLSEFGRKNPQNFSSGQKKKMLLAEALLFDPALLIMDEPAANLDPQARRDFFESLKLLNDEGKTLFISSHILTELEKYISHVTIIDQGEIKFTGSIKKLDTKKPEALTNYELVFEDAIPKLVLEYLKKKAISHKSEGNNLIFEVKNHDEVKALNKYLITEDIEFLSLAKSRHSLDDFFMEYVGNNNKKKS